MRTNGRDSRKQNSRSATSADPPIPKDLDAERTVLADIMLENSHAKAIAKIITSRDFVSPRNGDLSANGVMFREMLIMAEAQMPIDPLTLANHLRNKGMLELVGGVSYVETVADGFARIGRTNFEDHAKIIRDKSLHRRLAHLGNDLQQCATGGAESATDTLDRFWLELSQLRDRLKLNSDDISDTWEEFQNAKPLRARIDNFLWADVANVIGGLSGEGKTLILMATTKAQLTGEPLFRYFRVLEPAICVSYLIPECARAPFMHRARRFGLEPFLESGRLKVRTLSKGPRINLDDPRLLQAVRDSDVKIDTAARFGEGSENEATDVANGLATDIFGLLTAGAQSIQIAHHSPKSFAKDNYISLESCLRGSGDFGAFVGAGFGIRQVDKTQNIIHLEDIKPRDAEPFPPFQIIGRPHIDQEGDFRIHREPGTCGHLADHLETRNRGGAAESVREARAANLALLRAWLKEDPNQTSEQLAARFKAERVEISPVTVRKYKMEVTS
jgi:DnaB-like helicase N terminal domain/AAA domain